MKKLFIKLIEWYQKMPFSSHSSCKYEPTCSQYTKIAINEYGSFRGTFMGIWRILRCNPFSKGGYDPVPPRKNKKNNI